METKKNIELIVCEECTLFDNEQKVCWEGFIYDSEKCRENRQKRK